MSIVGAGKTDFKIQMALWGWAITAPDIPAAYRPDSALLVAELAKKMNLEATGLWDRDAAWLATTEYWVGGKREPSPYRWCLAGSPTAWAGAA